MVHICCHRLAPLVALAALALVPHKAAAVWRGFHPSFTPHYGCFGYCPGPLRPTPRPTPGPYWGCFGYCPGPLTPRHATCFGYCPSPVPIPYPYPYPTYSVYPAPVDYSPTYYGGNIYYNAPPVTPPAPAADGQVTYQGKSAADWTQNTTSDSARTRGESVAALGNLGPAAKGSTDALVKTLKDRDPNVRVEATLSLAKLGSGAVAALRAALADSDPLVRMGACLSLGHLGKRAEAAVGDVRKLLGDPDERVRCHAAQALWRITRRTDEALPVLVKALQASSDRHVRMGVLSTLSQMGTAARTAEPALTKALQDADLQVRLAAAVALRQVEPGSKSALTALVQALKEESAATRHDAAVALAQVGADAQEAGPVLGQALLDRSDAVSHQAAVALSHLGKVGVPQLVKGLKSDRAPVRAVSAEALGHLGPVARDAVPALAAIVEDPDQAVRQAVEEALRTIDAKGSPKSKSR